MKVILTCACGQRMQADSEHAGELVACPSCGEHLKVPSQAGSSPPAQQRTQSPPQSATPKQSAAGPEKLQVSCKCGTRLSVSRDLIGRTVSCPKCKQSFIVPAPKKQPQPQPRQPTQRAPAAAQQRPPASMTQRPAPVAESPDDPLGLGSLGLGVGGLPQEMPGSGFGPPGQPANFQAPMQPMPMQPMPMPAALQQPYFPQPGMYAGPGGHSRASRPFNSIRTGLLITAIGLWLLLGSFLITGIAFLTTAVFSSAQSSGSQAVDLGSTFFQISQIVALLSNIALVGGYGFCAAKSGAGRGVIIVAVVICAFNILFAMTTFLVTALHLDWGLFGSAATFYLAQLCLALHLFLAAAFVAKLRSQHRSGRGHGQRSPLAMACMVLIGIYGIVLVLVLPLGLLVGIIGMRNPGLAGIGGLIVSSSLVFGFIGLLVGVVLLSLNCLFARKLVPA